MQTIPYILIFSYLTACLLLFKFQNKLLFKGDRFVNTTPSDFKLTFEDIKFQSKDGTNLTGWWLTPATQKHTVLFLHGNAGSIADTIETAKILLELDCAVMVIDYRGFGLSGGSPSEQGLYEDVESAVTFIADRKGISNQDLIIFGRSLGAALAINISVSNRFKSLILDSPFYSLKRVAQFHYPLFPISLILKMDFDNFLKASNIRIPSLVFHSINDETIPYSHGNAVFTALGSTDKKFVPIKGTHGDGYLTSLDIYKKEIELFINKSY